MELDRWMQDMSQVFVAIGNDVKKDNKNLKEDLNKLKRINEQFSKEISSWKAGQVKALLDQYQDLQVKVADAPLPLFELIQQTFFEVAPNLNWLKERFDKTYKATGDR